LNLRLRNLSIAKRINNDIPPRRNNTTGKPKSRPRQPSGDISCPKNRFVIMEGTKILYSLITKPTPGVLL
jgi:hypothetical protein